MTPQNYSAYEKGREPPYEVLVKLAKYFSVTTDYLLGLSDFDSYNTEVLEDKIVINIEPEKSELNLFKLLPEIFELPSFIEFFKAIYIYVSTEDRELKTPTQDLIVSRDYGIMANFRINDSDKAREIILGPFVIDLLNDMKFEYNRNMRKGRGDLINDNNLIED